MTLFPPKSWRRRLAITAVVLLLLYTVGGFFLIPSLARPRLEALASEFVGKPVKLGSISFNPLALSIALRDVAIDPDNSPPIAFDELYGDVRALALTRLAVVIDSVHLQAPRVRLVLDKQGNLNLAQLFASQPSAEPAPAEPPPAEPATEDAALFPVSISSVTIDAGQLVFRDEQLADPFELELTPVTLELKDFSTQRDHSGNYVITAKTEKDGIIDWRGELSIDPLRAGGEINLEKIRARTLMKYAADAVSFGVKAGTLSLKTKYAYSDSGEQSGFALGPGDLSVDGLELREKKDQPPFLTVPRLQVGGIEVDVEKESVKIANVKSNGARLKAWLGSEGALGPPALFGEPQTAEPSPPPAEPKTEQGGWSVYIGDVSISDYGVAFEDRSLSPPVAVDVAPIGAKFTSLSFDPGAKTKVEVDLGLPDKGSVEVNGTAGLTPLDVDLELKIAGVVLNRFQPYVGRSMRVDIDSGAAAADGRLKVRAVDGQAPVVEYAGAASVKDLVVNDTGREEELVKWGSLALNEIGYQSQPPTLHIAEVVLEQPYARIVIDKEGKLNVSGLAVEPEGEPPPPPAPPPAAAAEEPMQVTIDTLTIQEGLADFADYSIKPSLDTGIYGLNGKIEGLSSDPAPRSKVALEGKVDKHAPVKVLGVINPFNPLTQTDLRVKFDNVSLTTFTPYSARFAGYKIKKGKASIELEYRIEDRRLVAENKVVLDKLTLGDKVEGPDATSLPVKLAVALLKNRKGQIDLSLPIRGDLDDPQFSYSAILGKTLVDLIQKAVASPFSVLGKLANFDTEELSQVEFAPGSSELREQQIKKLDALGDALRNRPELRLEVTGRADPAADRKQLAEAALIKELKRAKRTELKEEGLPAPKKLSQIELSADDYDRLFEARYKANFGAKPQRDQQGEISAFARTALADSLTIEDQDLRKLAQARAAVIQDRLAEAGVEQDRIYLLDVEIDTKAEGGEVNSELTLTS